MELLSTSIYFGSALTIAVYFLGLFIKKKTKLEICNPILIGIIVIILILHICNIDYGLYYETSKYITYFLTPTTVCLAIPLYKQIEVLKKNKIAIIAGSLAGVFASCISTLGVAYLLSLSNEEYYTLLPKSITTAIGLPLSIELGGIADITVALIILTGIFGNLSAVYILKLCRITDPVAKGVAIGTSSHAMGTVRAIEIGEVEGAMSSLAIAVSGVLTVIVVQLFL